MISWFRTQYGWCVLYNIVWTIDGAKNNNNGKCNSNSNTQNSNSINAPIKYTQQQLTTKKKNSSTIQKHKTLTTKTTTTTAAVAATTPTTNSWESRSFYLLLRRLFYNPSHNLAIKHHKPYSLTWEVPSSILARVKKNQQLYARCICVG